MQTGRFDVEPVLISLALGFIVGSVTLANNIRDMIDDGNNGFVTLPIKIGFTPARIMYYIFVLLPYVFIILLIITATKFYPVAITLLGFPNAFLCIREMKTAAVNLKIYI